MSGKQHRNHGPDRSGGQAGVPRRRGGWLGFGLVVLLVGGAIFVQASLRSRVNGPETARSPNPGPAEDPSPPVSRPVYDPGLRDRLVEKATAEAMAAPREGLPVSPGASPGNLAGASAWYMEDGHLIRRVPEPGDPEYEDWTRMIRYWKSVMAIRGDGVPYDPEWRAPARGRRLAEVHDLPLQGGAGSMTQLAEFILLALESGEPQAFVDLRINREEFDALIWPEFPDSRPYTNITSGDSWMFSIAKSSSGIADVITRYEDRKFDRVGIRFREITGFTNFKLYRDVVLRVRDIDTGEEIDLDVVRTVVERKGRFKVYIYKES